MAISSQTDQIDTRTAKDALVNVMGTMVMLMMRLTYRKHNTMKREQRHGLSWTQSIGYDVRSH